MRNPDFNRTFIDASGVGVGAVLIQEEEEDQLIAYFSSKILPRERHYRKGVLGPCTGSGAL